MPTTSEPRARIRVFMVEDQPVILKQQIRMLQKSPDVEIVGSAGNGKDALDELGRVETDVVLMDLDLPDTNGIVLTRTIKERTPHVEVLIFTIFDEEEKVLEAIRAGASGYLLKGAQMAKIVEAIRDVFEGGSVIQPGLARRMLKLFQQPEGGAAEPAPPALTERETEILQIIARGLSNSEAAEVLKLSRATVRTHLEHIYAKLQVTNRVEAVTEGIRHGLIKV